MRCSPVMGWCGKSLSRTATHALPAASPPETKTRYFANSRRKTCCASTRSIGKSAFHAGRDGKGASISLSMVLVHHELRAVLGHHHVNFCFYGLPAKTKGIHRRTVRAQFAHFFSRSVPKRTARADCGAHRFLPCAGAVVA